MGNKMTIKADRPDCWSGWGSWRGRGRLSACYHDVDRLFGGLKNSTECFFEITSRRPRTPDYHRFEWYSSNYQTTEETSGGFSLIFDTSKIIRRAMKGADTIYVAVYTEEG